MRNIGTIEFGTASHNRLAQLKEWFHLVPMQTDRTKWNQAKRQWTGKKADFALVQKLMEDDSFVCIIVACPKCQTEQAVCD